MAKKYFNLSGSKLLLTDPCYNNNGSDCAAVLENVAPGRWLAGVSYEDGYVKNMELFHDDLGAEPGGWERIEGLCVDSGQLGAFDPEFYPEDRGEFDDKGGFYDLCCKETLSKSRYGVVNKVGVVSSSGFGDGSYDAWVRRDVNGLVRYVRVDFISDEDGLEEEG